ncbi:DUF2059 domain-containing protein [Xanthomonas sp. XNM01]|mgnify:CR=1 FL=1|jgi:hypothetical protein|uniref:DUF2059 domain-containing protein n=1 Tax=Xanthomonas sp. XNM01 TaxID=2769289 RepID=UPI00177B12FF|nr:DUF2059 domain-containing protein [Xanthomonas sp. XNM01]MBD9370535.1 DUF2059 domain-containing protein [Xanthomonas sp. XNM01]
MIGLRLAALLLAFCACAPLHAAAPTDAQLQRLFELTRVEQEYQAFIPQFEQMQRDLALRAIPDDASPERIAAAEREMASTQADIRRIMAWERMLPMYLDIYRRTYSAEDVAAMITFYESPAGQRVIAAQGTLMRNIMEAVTLTVQPELEQLLRKTGDAHDGHAH